MGWFQSPAGVAAIWIAAGSAVFFFWDAIVALLGAQWATFAVAMGAWLLFMHSLRTFMRGPRK